MRGLVRREGEFDGPSRADLDAYHAHRYANSPG